MIASQETFRFFSEAQRKQLSRSEEILQLFKTSKPAIELLARDAETVKLTKGIRLVSVGDMTDFPAELKYPSIRLPSEKGLVGSWMADAQILVVSDMYLAGQAAELINLSKNPGREKMLFICFKEGAVQPQGERETALKQLFKLVDQVTPSLRRVFVVGRGEDQEKKIKSLLGPRSLIFPERILRISTPCILPNK